MDPQIALQTAVVLLAVTAAGGVLMVLIRVRGAPRPPTLIAMVHGLLAGAALTLILFTWWQSGIPELAKIAVGVLLLAAVGGVVLNVRYHAQLQPLPVSFMLGHAAVAVTGFVLLALAVFGGVQSG